MKKTTFALIAAAALLATSALIAFCFATERETAPAKSYCIRTFEAVPATSSCICTSEVVIGCPAGCF